MDKLFKSIEAQDFPVDYPGHFIAGSWEPSGKGAELRNAINPSSGDLILTAGVSKSQVLESIVVAEAALKDIKEVPLNQRFEILEKFRQILGDYQDLIISVLRLESGKAKWEAEHELRTILSFMDNFLGARDSFEEQVFRVNGGASSDFKVNFRSIGVVAAHIPFSECCGSFVQYFCAAIISGCPIVFVSSIHVALFSLVMSSLIEKINVRPGLVNIMVGGFADFQLLAQSRQVRGLLYRGSKEHCMVLKGDSRRHWGRFVDLRSGGKNSALVLPSASIADAIEAICIGAFMGAGQLCASTSRVFVHRDILAEFVNLLVMEIKSIKIGPTNIDDVQMGPLYSAKARDKFLRFQTMAKRESAKTVLWGKAIVDHGPGNFVSPGVHIFDSVDNSSAFQSNVLFLPDISIYEYESLEGAVSMINQTDAPLAVSVFGSGSIPELSLLAPNVVINGPTVEFSSTHSFSGMGYCSNNQGIDFGLTARLLTAVAMKSEGSKSLLFGSWRR